MITRFELYQDKLYTNADRGNLSGEYVPLAEYQELQAQYQELADNSAAGIKSLVSQRYQLQMLIRRVIKIGNELFGDPELSPNWHWKDYLMDLDKLVVDCREALK